MPFAFGNVATFTSSAGGDIGGGRSFTRLKGPVLLGQPNDNAGASNIIQPPHLVNVSTVSADMLASVSSTFASTASVTVSTATPKGLVYITLSSADMIQAGSTANAPVGLPGGQAGAAILWDSGKKTLAIYDPLSSAWLWPHAQVASTASLTGGVITWSASSS